MRLTSATEIIEPSLPDADAREILDLAEDEALFRIPRNGYVDGEPVECRIALVRGQRFAFTSSWDRARTIEPVSFGARPSG